MTISSNAVQMALRGQMLRCASLPDARSYGNITFKPTPGNAYVEEDYVPATKTLKGLTSGGLVEDTGLYYIKWYGVENTGEQDINAGVDSLLALFPPALAIPLTDGSGLVVRIRGDTAPYRGQLRIAKPGFVVVVVTIPYRVFSTNPITT